jgi:hypothetical protein
VRGKPRGGAADLPELRNICPKTASAHPAKSATVRFVVGLIGGRATVIDPAQWMLLDTVFIQKTVVCQLAPASGDGG